ncbi:MAG: ORF6N domain-containing protein, partial [Victivallales bacterium]|nr:ORF6N domain-containing protein [Victivallales bacterium]
MSTIDNQIVSYRANEVVSEDAIKTMIMPVRGMQVMLDRDLAVLYGVEVKYLNRQVKRNIERFPPDFMFQLTKEDCLRCQIGTLNGKRGEHIKYMPYAFTENGIAMLSGVLRSPTAIEINIRIMRAFVAMRRAFANVEPMLARVETVERRQITDQQRNEERFETIFKAMDGGDFPPQKVFFEGKHYDAYSFARKLVRKAAKSIVLVDGYCDDVTLDILASKRGGADVTIATVAKTPITQTAIEKFNKQSPTLTVKT